MPLANLNDLVFGGWDIYEDSAYEAAVHAKVLEKDLLNQVKEPLDAIETDAGGLRSRIREADQRSPTSSRRRTT